MIIFISIVFISCKRCPAYLILVTLVNLGKASRIREIILQPWIQSPAVELFNKEHCGDRHPSQIKFLLYSNNRTEAEELMYEDFDSISQSLYQPTKSSKILIHGFMQHDGTNFPKNVREAYLSSVETTNLNIIVADWGALACSAHQDYKKAVSNVGKAGKRIGEFISWLHRKSLIDLNTTHIVGHSLGSHVAGEAGNTVSTRTGHQVSRITGLDPAGPDFEVEVSPARGLRPNDAKFVDVIHTNVGEFGISRAVGHVDFYVNSGQTQPECATAVNDVFCSHQMSTWYFANTIRKEQNFKRCACKTSILYPVHPFCCDAKVKFGEYADPKDTGLYYINYSLKGAI